MIQPNEFKHANRGESTQVPYVLAYKPRILGIFFKLIVGGVGLYANQFLRLFLSTVPATEPTKHCQKSSFNI